MSVIVPGLEARHQWVSATGQVTLGDLDVWPRHRIVDIMNLRGRADPEDARDLATGRPGEIPRPSVRRGKTVAYQCVTEARNLNEFRDAQSVRDAAFEELSDEGMMTVTVHPDLPMGPPAVLYRARCLSCEPATEQPADPARGARGYEQPFTVSMRMADRRFYRAQQAGPFETAALAVESGISLPVSAPFVIPAPGSVSGTVTVVNEGDADTDPTVVLWGPALNPRVMNDTLGVELRFAPLELQVGQFLTIDFAARTAKLEGTVDYRARLDRTRISWWGTGVPGLKPGPNVIRFRADSSADPARAVLTYFHATT